MRREGEHDPSAAIGRNSTQSDIPCLAGPCPFTQPCYQLGEGRLRCFRSRRCLLDPMQLQSRQ